jgi:hypothetical protein
MSAQIIKFPDEDRQRYAQWFYQEVWIRLADPRAAQVDMYTHFLYSMSTEFARLNRAAIAKGGGVDDYIQYLKQQQEAEGKAK